jgi:hypothetical protein
MSLKVNVLSTTHLVLPAALVVDMRGPARLVVMRMMRLV